jgi:hypothetical protein
MGLESFNTGEDKNSGSRNTYHSDSDAKYKNGEWLADELEKNTIKEIADECGVACNAVYYYIDKYNLNESNDNGAEQIEKYISQFVDADGTIQLNAQSRGSNSNFAPRVSCANTFEVEIASLIDAEGSMNLRPQKLSSGKLGYKITSSIETSQQFHKQQEAALARFYSMVDTFCQHVDIELKYSISQRDSGILFRWQVNKWDDVATVLETISDHLVLKVEQARIFLDHAYPMYCEGKHTTKDGFIKMAGHADDVAKLRDNNGTRKYTQEYFKNTDAEDW